MKTLKDYIRLKNGTMLKKGDMCGKPPRWWKTQSVGFRVGEPGAMLNPYYRRIKRNKT